MNPIFNTNERRLRAGFRILIFIVLTIIFILPSNFINIAWLTYLYIAFATFASAFITAKYIDKRPLSGIGLAFNKKWGRDFLLGLSIALIAQSLIFLIEWQSGWLQIKGFAWNTVHYTAWYTPILYAFLQMLAVGFYEEVFFRGYALKNLAEGFTFGGLNHNIGLIIAVVFTSVIFGLAHLSNPNANLISTVNIIFAGLMLALPYILTGSLGLSVGIHFAWNFSMGSIFGLPVSGLDLGGSIISTEINGPAIFTGGEFGPEAGITGLVGMLVISCLVVILQIKREGRISIHPIFLKKFDSDTVNTNKLDELA